MPRWRDIRAAALRDAQDVLRVSALYVAAPGATPLPVSIRVLDRPRQAESDRSETGYGFLFDLTPWIVFDRNEVPRPLARAVVVLGETEAYRLGVTMPTVHQFQRVEAVPVSAREAAAIWRTGWSDLLPATRYRTTKRAARKALHGEMQVAAVYLTHLTGDPVRVEVRIHTDINPVEVLRASSPFIDTTPRVIFEEAVAPRPLTLAYVIVSEDEIYRTGPAKTPEDGMVQVEVSPLLDSERAAFLAALDPDTDLPVWEGIL